MNKFLRFTLVVSAWLAVMPGLMAEGPNHDFARWEKEISAYERVDATNAPPKGCIVFIGSSTIARWKTLTEDFSDWPVVNRGFGGSEVVDSTHFAPRVLFPYQPGLIFFRAGGNDLAAGKSVAQVFTNFQEFAEAVHAKLPEAKLVYISWSPSRARWSQHEKEKELNQLVADYIQSRPWLYYLETYDLPLGADGHPREELFVADKLHFNAAGYRLLAERVRPVLSKFAPVPESAKRSVEEKSK
jgi:lysophospholipase L1-like esterase